MRQGIVILGAEGGKGGGNGEGRVVKGEGSGKEERGVIFKSALREPNTQHIDHKNHNN
jgi:hypothetical protein